MKQNTFLLQIAWSLLYIAELSKGYLISVLEDFPQLSFNLRCHCILFVYGLHSAIYCVP